MDWSATRLSHSHSTYKPYIIFRYYQSSPEESIQYGIDQLLQAMPIFTTLNAQLDEKRKGAAAAAVSLVPSPRSGSLLAPRYSVLAHYISYLLAMLSGAKAGGEQLGMMDIEHAICCMETGWQYMIQVRG